MLRPERVLVHPVAQPQHDALEAAARLGHRPQASVWRSYQTALLRIRADILAGEVVRRGSIPRYFTTRYDAANLYVIDLAAFHRLTYTLDGRDVILLDVMDHPTYDRIFGFRKR